MGVLVGKPAPDFNVAAVLGTGEIVDSYKRSEEMAGKYGLVFFYPLDFTFVCPSELIALDHRMDKFRERKGAKAPWMLSSSRSSEKLARRMPLKNSPDTPLRYQVTCPSVSLSPPGSRA